MADLVLASLSFNWRCIRNEIHSSHLNIKIINRNNKIRTHTQAGQSVVITLKPGCHGNLKQKHTYGNHLQLMASGVFMALHDWWVAQPMRFSDWSILATTCDVQFLQL